MRGDDTRVTTKQRIDKRSKQRDRGICCCWLIVRSLSPQTAPPRAVANLNAESPPETLNGCLHLSLSCLVSSITEAFANKNNTSQLQEADVASTRTAVDMPQPQQQEKGGDVKKKKKNVPASPSSG
uniref:Uncharacterized protein n=1 Tax=Kalanchoe fedtschenkoi TaxID=63787 RepID=A0A7N0U8C3_KALFE